MAIMWNSAILEELHHTAALDKDRTAWKYIWVSQGFPSQRHNSNYFRQGRERAGILLSLKDCYQKSMSPFLLPHASFVHKLKLQLLEASGLNNMPRSKKVPLHQFWCERSQRSTLIGPGRVPRLPCGSEVSVLCWNPLLHYESEILGQIPEPSDWREDKAHFLKEVVIQACQAKNSVVPVIKIREEGLPTRLTPTGAASSRDPSVSASSYEKPTDPVHPETARERWDLSPGTEAQNSVFLWLQEWFSVEMVPYLKEGFKVKFWSSQWLGGILAFNKQELEILDKQICFSTPYVHCQIWGEPTISSWMLFLLKPSIFIICKCKHLSPS